MGDSLKLNIDLSEIKPEIKKPAADKKEMLSVKVEDGQTIVRINNSSLSLLQVCPRKFQYLIEEGYQPKEGSPPLIFGSALHQALEVFYLAEREQRVLPNNYEENLDLMGHGHTLENEEPLIYTATRKFINEASPLANLPASDKRSIPNGVWILRHYFEAYINDPYTIYKHEGEPVVELRMEHTIHDSAKLKINLFGTVDAVFENQATGEIIVGDHKTTSIVGNDFYNRLKPNHQYTGYIYLAQEVLGLKTDKFLVNGLQVKPRPKTARGTAPHFPRQVTTRTLDDITDFRKTVVSYVTNMLAMQEQGYFPMGSVDACANYGACMFLPVCGAPENLKQPILNNQFTKVK
jgi:hypothetical protein